MKIEQNNAYDFPNIMCANVRSVANKIDEISIEMDRHKVDLAIFTETWLNDDIPNEILRIDGYDILRNDRKEKRGGGVSIYIKHSIPYKHFLCENKEKETIWRGI